MIVEVPDNFMADMTADEITTFVREVICKIQIRLTQEERKRLITVLREPNERKKKQRVREWTR
jgi:hypothetical protein